MGETNNLSVVLVLVCIVVGYFFIFCYRKVRKNLKNQPQVDFKEKEKPELPPLASIELTEKQLAEYNGTREDGRILVAFKGNIYDVSSGMDEFGPKGALTCVAGKNFSVYLNHTLENAQTKLGFVERWQVLLDKNYERVGTLVDEELKEDKGKEEEKGKDKEKEKAQVDDNLKDKDTLDCKQENAESFNISDDAKLGESMEESINETVINQTLVNDKTINLMKDVVPDEMLDNELPPKTLTEEVA